MMLLLLLELSVHLPPSLGSVNLNHYYLMTFYRYHPGPATRQIPHHIDYFKFLSLIFSSELI